MSKELNVSLVLAADCSVSPPLSFLGEHWALQALLGHLSMLGVGSALLGHLSMLGAGSALLGQLNMLGAGHWALQALLGHLSYSWGRGAFVFSSGHVPF